MKALTVALILLLSACDEGRVAWDLAYGTYEPEHVSGSDGPFSSAR